MLLMDERTRREMAKCGPVLAFDEATKRELRQVVWIPPTSAELSTAVEREEE